MKAAAFTPRPLGGKRVLVARARPGPSQVAERLRDLGAEVVELPDVRVVPPADPLALVAALKRVSSYGVVIFASTTSVDKTRDVLADRSELGAGLRRASVLAIGAGVGAALRRAGVTPAVELPGACKEELARHLPRFGPGRVLVISHDGGRPSLLEDLAALGVVVDTASAYSHAYEFSHDLDVPPDLVVVPSSSATEAVLNGPIGPLIARVPIIAMGPKTEAAARRLGAHAVSRSRRDTVRSMVAAVVAFLAPTRSSIDATDGAASSRRTGSQ